jgi:Glyoxalase superfamily protein/Clp amino terminal domain, pathogenicity island component
MRSFRDAKAMARTIRAALSEKGMKITNSESLELIAAAFGVGDWNTLSAMIRREVNTAPANAPPTSVTGGTPVLPFSTEFASTMRRALLSADQRNHDYATLEHLVLALTDDKDASATIRTANTDLAALKASLIDFLDNDLGRLVTDSGEAAKPSPAFHRVVQRAGPHAHGPDRLMLTGVDVLAEIFAETASPAARLLGEHGLSRDDLARSSA